MATGITVTAGVCMGSRRTMTGILRSRMIICGMKTGR
jgi:hypothetical protein